MKILIILPNWLGDAVMATPAIELLASYYENPRFTFVGSYVSIEALKYHPLCEEAVIDETKQAASRILATYNLAKALGKFDMAVSFRDNIYSSILLRLTGTVVCCARRSWHAQLLLSHTPKISTQQHLVKQYTQIALANIDAQTYEIPPLKLYIPPKKFIKPTLGINAGATYGSAKRWYPERFGAVASYFSDQYDIIIFGGPNEVEMAKEIEESLLILGVSNYTNLAGKTNIPELCANIGGCSLFITNDSGPMHIAAAYQVPTVAIFGPTKYKETSQWQNPKGVIVKKDIDCAPCMKRECPLKHHECMKSITSEDVIKKAEEIV